MMSTALLALALCGAANDSKFEEMRDYIRPKPNELQWEGVEWKPTLWSAVVEAQQKDKPILLWAMNGHPMACT
ncbi:MAG TPA: hypothetical protein VM328_07850 [Fimbriimonadaceae bacterium]|nr:hypothetical protein [Fimbriimonadaceae bacterium]